MLGLTMAPLWARADEDPSKDDKGPAIISVSVIFTTIAFTTTVLRLWVRKGRRALGWDDLCISMAMALTVIEAALTIQAVTRGKGKRGKFLSKSDVQYINMFSWYAQHVLFAAMALVKISVCLLVYRIKNSKSIKIITGVVMAVLITSALECSIVLLAQCRPIAAHWRPAAGKCWPPEIRIYSIYVQAGVSILTDLVCSSLPIVIVRNVQLPLKKKISISLLMGLGLVCTACSAVRAKSLNAKATDLAYEYGIVSIWAITELCLGIIATNLALSRSIYFYFFRRDEMTTTNSYPYGSRSRSRGLQQQSESKHSQFSQFSTTARMERNPSQARSEDSDIPLKPVIEKRTDVSIHVQ